MHEVMKQLRRKLISLEKRNEKKTSKVNKGIKQNILQQIHLFKVRGAKAEVFRC